MSLAIFESQSDCNTQTELRTTGLEPRTAQIRRQSRKANVKTRALPCVYTEQGVKRCHGAVGDSRGEVTGSLGIQVEDFGLHFEGLDTTWRDKIAIQNSDLPQCMLPMAAGFCQILRKS
jgi:hypothetical protein